MPPEPETPPQPPTTDPDPSPNHGFPKPDFTEIVQDDTTPERLETPEKNDILSKPTFKSTLQAKKRLQAFSSNRVTLPTSPLAKKAKTEEKNEEPVSPLKKTPRKGMVF